MKFEVKVLGSSSAHPAQGRHPSAQVLNAHDKLYLLDCGEGTQIQMHRYNVKRGRINHIFISHLHGDHVFGLVPLLTSYALYSRTDPLYIYGPEPLASFIHHQLECMSAKLPFELVVKELTHGTKEEIMNDGNIRVSAFPLLHRITTYGYFIEECPRPPHILPDQMEKHQVELSKIPRVKKEATVTNIKGEEIPTELLTTPADPPRSYAYMSDTAFSLDFADHIRNVNMLYHEATFTHDLKERADKTMHSTAREAAQLAEEANAGKLLLGHFSSRYSDLTVIEEEAGEIFENTFLAIEGEKFLIDAKG